PEPSAASPMDGLEPTISIVPDGAPPATSALSDLVDIEHTADAVGPTVTLDGLEGVALAEPGLSAEPSALDGLEATAFEAPPVDVAPAPGLEVTIDLTVPTGEPTIEGHEDEATPTAEAAPPTSGGAGLVFIDTDAPTIAMELGVAPTTADSADAEVTEAPSVPAPLPPMGEPPADPLGYRVRAHALFEHGDRAGGIADLEQALAGYTEGEEWLHAWQVASELIEAEPAAIARHQARVELAARMRDPVRLAQAYLALGETLTAEGSSDKAVAVYRRVLEIDETNATAREALRRMQPEAPTEASADGFIDLGAMLIDSGPRSTRMRTETTAISADEDETFREALAEFKRALDQNLPIEDHQVHYDLGIAFKEMGLLDEAIGEFQKALRSPEGRLRTSEALGQAFFDQGRPAVAEAVLRSVAKGDEGDADKIGVLYWLGRALEAQGKLDEARGCFERVLAVDVSFHDVTDRLAQLGSGGAA
ncbi:MAG TPA: tetratricopeptide repeat protein, partial [Gemmatimonadales bacterium]|nr:tetratricopeptide repeat protein [Gemmatimonadales bacterium]